MMEILYFYFVEFIIDWITGVKEFWSVGLTKSYG